MRRQEQVELPSQGDLMTAVLRHLGSSGSCSWHPGFPREVLGSDRIAYASPANTGEAVFRALQELMALGLVVPGADHQNNHWPWLGLTDRGRAILAGDSPAVHDLEGYLADLRRAVPELDEDALQYAGEAVQAFALNLLRAATVMIGTASEILIRRLIEAWAAAVTAAVGGTEGTKLCKVVEERGVAFAFREFEKSFEQHKHRIDERRFKQDTLAVIEQVFHFIRLCRNDAGHAIGLTPPDRPLVQAHLVEFRYYARRLYDLIAYLDAPGLAP